MRIKTGTTGAVVVVLLAVAWMAGCEDSDVLAPEGGSLIMTANPSTVVKVRQVPLRGSGGMSSLGNDTFPTFPVRTFPFII